MFIALDSNGNRIDVKNAEKGNDYFCPVCNNPLQVKEGKIKIKHFAHISGSDCDDFSTDMSEWHRNWQEQFPADSREIVITIDNESHRADVAFENYVIEFQNSPITAEKFEQRNAFYTKAGKKVIWIFNLIDDFRKGHFVKIETFRGGAEWKWKYSNQCFHNFVPQKRKGEVILLFQLKDADFLNNDNPPNYLKRVSYVWELCSPPFSIIQMVDNPSNKQSLLQWITSTLP